MSKEIWVVPSFGQGHLSPFMELCKHIASRGFKTSLVISSNLSSSIPSSLRQHPLLHILEIHSPPPPPSQPGSDPMLHHHRHHDQMASALEEVLASRPDPVGPVCAILDVTMSWASEVFQKFQIPIVGLFTSGACSTAMEFSRHEAFKRGPHGPPPGSGGPPGLEGGGPPGHRLKPQDPAPDPVRPSEFRTGWSSWASYFTQELQRPRIASYISSACSLLMDEAPRIANSGPLGLDAGFPPAPKPGNRPPWLDVTERTIALLINTCDDLEPEFIADIANRIGKRVWGVGPLWPEQYWRSTGLVLHDPEISTNRRLSVVIKWLDTKPRESVLYVSFGSEVGPTMEEYTQLADALEASTRPFIWVIQQGSGRSGHPRTFIAGKPGSGPEAEERYFPDGLEGKVGERGLILRGWAPATQLLILSHPSTGRFLSHCGWNSIVEGIGRGVPFLAWPIRGDQYNNAKLVVSHLEVGYMISDDLSETVKKEDILKGIEKLMDDEDVKKRAVMISTKFQQGFPVTSMAALDAFRDFINHKFAA